MVSKTIVSSSSTTSSLFRGKDLNFLHFLHREVCYQLHHALLKLSERQELNLYHNAPKVVYYHYTTFWLRKVDLHHYLLVMSQANYYYSIPLLLSQLLPAYNILGRIPFGCIVIVVASYPLKRVNKEFSPSNFYFSYLVFG